MEIPFYTLKEPREDAAGLWTARVELDAPWPREDIIRCIGEFAIATQNVHALMTGYIEGDPGVEYGSAIVFTRDPHSDEAYVTLSPSEYEVLAQTFADQYGMHKVPYSMDSEFRVILGRVPGYSEELAYPMDDVGHLLEMGYNSLSLEEGYFFSARYQDEGRWWKELAAVIRGNLNDLPKVGPTGFTLNQARFVCETHPQTLVYNKIVEGA
jgi:hypothetical protein